jgi:hypothetical protein
MQLTPKNQQLDRDSAMPLSASIDSQNSYVTKIVRPRGMALDRPLDFDSVFVKFNGETHYLSTPE